MSSSARILTTANAADRDHETSHQISPAGCILGIRGLPLDPARRHIRGPGAVRGTAHDLLRARATVSPAGQGRGKRGITGQARRLPRGHRRRGRQSARPVPGYAGFVGWESPIRLENGEWLVGFNAGYWHASAPTPLNYSPKTLEEYRKLGMPADVVAPTGGRAMIMRSRDEGKTWSKPETLFDSPADDRHPAFVHLRDGTILCSFFIYLGEEPEATARVRTRPARVLHSLLRQWPDLGEEAAPPRDSVLPRDRRADGADEGRVGARRGQRPTEQARPIRPASSARRIAGRPGSCSRRSRLITISRKSPWRSSPTAGWC